jgi:FkbM family methyltransferase
MNYYKMRLMIPSPVKNVLRKLSYLSMFSDWRSAVSYYRVNHAGRDKPLPSSMELKIRQLKHHPIRIRSHSTDARVVFSTFVHRFHLPPRGVMPDGAALILDLGSNIGCTIAHLACLYPEAAIVGVELDAGNARLCRQNISPWGDRCRVIEGAIWAEDGQVQYERQEGCEDGFAAGVELRESAGELQTARAISLNTLVSEICSSDQMIDYVKMDIEGAEREVLRRNNEWAARVRSIKIELHGNYSKEECVADLQELGFEAWADNNHALCAVGIRKL